MARTKAALAILLLFAMLPLTAILLPTATAGDIDDPDMEDKADDAASGRAARDLIAGWVSNETEESLEFNLQMSSLEPFTPYADWQSLPVVYYEFFFDVSVPDGVFSYSVRATIPMHGPLASFATYDLFLVTYGAQGSVQNTSAIGNPTGRYIVNAAMISFTVAKTDIGAPARGDSVEGIWARTQSASQRNTGDAITEDTMMSHVSPGRSFPITGGITFYAITITVTSPTTVNTTIDLGARFDFLLQSDSEKSANVQVRAATQLPANWTFSTDHQLYTVDAHGNATGQFTITPGGNITNVTRRITINWQFVDDQNGTRSTENTQTVSIFVPAAPGGPGGGGGGGGGKKGQDSTFVYVGAGVGVAAAGIGGSLYYFYFFLPAQRRKRARASFSKIAQMKLGKAPRSGPAVGPPLPMPRPGAPAGPIRPVGPRAGGQPPMAGRPRSPGGPTGRPLPPRR